MADHSSSFFSQSQIGPVSQPAAERVGMRPHQGIGSARGSP